MATRKHKRRGGGGDGHRRNNRYRPDRQRFLPDLNGPPRCSGCAFTPGTVANVQPLTLVKARLCAAVLEPFLCHAPLQTGPDGVTRLPEKDRMLCRGWVDLVDALSRQEYFNTQTEEGRAALRTYLSAVIELEDDLLAGGLVTMADVPPEIRAAVRQIREA